MRQGDTDDTPTGAGTGGSRSIPIGGAGVDGAARTLAEKLRRLAADALEADMADVELVDGSAVIAGTDRRLAFVEIAALPQARPEDLSATDAFKPPEATYPNGTHVCELEIDPETGAGLAGGLLRSPSSARRPGSLARGLRFFGRNAAGGGRGGGCCGSGMGFGSGSGGLDVGVPAVSFVRYSAAPGRTLNTG